MLPSSALQRSAPPAVVPGAIGWLVVAAGFVLGVANAGASLKADDVWSRNVVLAPWPELLRTLHEDVHPPLYFLLLKPVVSLLGDAEFGLRLLSIVLYWLSGVAMYRMARRFLPSEGALIATAVFLTAPLASLSAELVRMYSLLALLAILSTTALIDFLRKSSWCRMAVFAGLTICGTFTHLWYFCLLAGQGLAVLMRAPRQVGRVLGAVAVGVAPYVLLWLPILVRQLDRSREAAAWLPPPDLEMLPQIAFLWLGMTILLLPWLAWQWRRLVAAARESGAEAAAWSAWLLVGSVVPPLAVSFFKPFFYSRFTIVALPFVALLVGWMLWRAAGVHAAAVLAVVAMLMTLGLHLSSPQCTGRWAAAHLLDHARPGDFVIYSGLSRPAARYYLDRARPDRRWTEQTFPAEIDSHPGYEGAVGDPMRVPALRREATGLAERIRHSPSGTQVFLLEGRIPAVEAILKEALSSPFPPASGTVLRPVAVGGCPSDGGGYFHTISTWILR